ncbi:thermonuclease family protein [Nocardioides guangzhouensis]|uniref:thermonuclease family protein n=1 Tax=Nocardioides guangzhouensis TaxID=2497878 RepID=UPI00143836CB|nr:hypothetical protein [Nocardioides guangzhouensis]
MRRIALVAAAVAALTGGLLVTTPGTATAATTATTARVVRWVDGDTVTTSRGTVRLIGVDTPETGHWGARNATRLARHWAPAGSTVRLVNPSSVHNRDRYGRLLRYVQRGRDIGLVQINHGAKARYDGRDGYDWHPRQHRYRTTDARHADYRAPRPSSGGSGGGGGGSTAPAGSSCPKSAPIKGNRPSMIYHMPWNAYYDVTTPEQCFATRAGAERAGYRAAKI